MSHILKNNNVEIHIDSPLEGYQLSRFDWTGKITRVLYKNKNVSGVERTDVVSDIDFGKGFYNEFGIETPVGYDETKIGGWFHKIGVGLLKKTYNEYGFYKNYEIKPAFFEIVRNPNSTEITCISEIVNGFGYVLLKIIELKDNGFVITYKLNNTGSKTIITDEYNHNFISLDLDLMGLDYKLNFPFELEINKFKEKVNDEEKVIINNKEISFKGTPKDPFFFSDLSGSEELKASWELVNLKKKLAIQETVSFKSDKVNLWGWTHVISPEIFFKINLRSGESVKWSRTYIIHELK